MVPLRKVADIYISHCSSTFQIVLYKLWWAQDNRAPLLSLLSVSAWVIYLVMWEYCHALVQFESFQCFLALGNTKLMELCGFCRMAAWCLASSVFSDSLCQCAHQLTFPVHQEEGTAPVCAGRMEITTDKKRLHGTHGLKSLIVLHWPPRCGFSFFSVRDVPSILLNSGKFFIFLSKYFFLY